MPIPTSATWNLADFDESTIGSLLTLGGGLVTITPSVSPYFTYNALGTILTARSSDGVEARIDLDTPVPSQFTVEITARFREMPHNLGDLANRRIGLTVADDDGRGISIYFAKTGVAIARIDDYGSVTALEDTSDTTEEVSTAYSTIRVAVDGALARAYVYIGPAGGVTPEVRFVLPVQATPASVVDTFRLFAKGLVGEPASIDIRTLRLASGLVVPNFPPVANAGGDRVSTVGQAVRFDGRGSFDVEGAPLTYQWRLVDAPLGSAGAAETGSGTTTDDGDADGLTDTLVVPTAAVPAWLAAGDIVLLASTRAVVATVDSGTGTIVVTTESLPEPLSAASVRFVRQTLVGATTETPYLVPDTAGLYRVELVVNDGISDSEASEIVVSAVAARAPLGLEPDVSPLWKALGDEWPLITNREVFEEFWKGTAQIYAAKLLEAWQYHYNFSIRDAQRVLQRKWVAFRTLVAEPKPEDLEIAVRRGVLEASHEFELGNPAVTGLTLVFEVYAVPGGDPTLYTVTLTGDDLFTIETDIIVGAGAYVVPFPHAPRIPSSATMYEGVGTAVDDGDGDAVTNFITCTPGTLPAWVSQNDIILIGGTRHTIFSADSALGEIYVVGTQVPYPLVAEPFTIWRRCRLFIAGTPMVRLHASSTAASVLGLPVGEWGSLHGSQGQLVTDRTYYVGGGIDLSYFDVARGDLLVLNNGQSFKIDRILSSPSDPYPNQRLLLETPLPADASPEWSIPDVITGSEVDYEFEGVYPGDLLKAEAYDVANGTTVDITGAVVAQKGSQLAVNFTGYYAVHLRLEGGEEWETRIIGVKRRKAIPIQSDVVGIPRLQDLIPVAQDPTIYSENVDYILEPFYRDLGGAPLPMLQFRDAVFIDTDLEPPDILWAELVLLDNERNVENLFGQLVNFLKDDASTYPPDFNYVAGVAGLLYAYQRGPNVDAIGIGAQILFGQSFAEAAGVIEEIRHDFSPTQGRILIRDQDGNDPTQSETVRTYYYKKDPLDTSLSSGLDTNPDTSLPWAVGDTISQFAPIGTGIDVVDLYNTPSWYVPYVRSGLITEIEKFHHFLVTFNLDLVTLTNLTLLSQFVLRVKPSYTYPLLVGMRNHEEDIDVTDELEGELDMYLYDSPCGDPHAWMYDDYDGSGVIRSEYDDGDTYYDAHVDCPVDIIELEIEIDWAGGIATFDSGFFADVEITDVSGAETGIPGSTFYLLYDMDIAAGTYIMTVVIKAGGVVLP